MLSCAVLTILALALPNLSDSGEVRRSLGGYPLCEASASIIVPCPQSKKKTCLLAGDNEIRDRLFLFEIAEEEDKKKYSLIKRREIYVTIPPPEEDDVFELSDIEALVPLPSGEIVIYGSHSRNKNCKGRGNRRIFARGKLGTTELGEGAGKSVKSKKHKCDRLFGEETEAKKHKVCEAISSSEVAAKSVNELSDEDARENECNAIPTFNLEGAMAVPRGDGAARVWVGLRSPLVGGKAVLLRQVKGLDQFKFDAVAFLDLGAHGIRDLAFVQKKKKFWIIAGPPNDKKTPHALWHADVGLLKDGATIKPVFAQSLPSYAEGLAIHNSNAFVLIDGSESKSKTVMSCETESEYIIRSIQ